MDKTKILIIAANPWDTKRLGLDEEYREIDAIKQKSKQRDQFVLEYAPASRDEDLRQKLLDFEPHIIHFSGHGELGALYFLDDTGESHKIRKEALAKLFALFSNQIRCVVLNACYSEEQARAISQYIDLVIGMNNSISDVAAIKYSTVFYQALFSGKEIEFAHEFACNAIDAANFPEYQTPVIFRRQPFQSEQVSKTYLSGYQIDVLIHAASTEKAWAEAFIYELKKFVGQKLEGLDKGSIHLQIGEIDFSQAATIILLLSPDYVEEYKSIFNQFTQPIQKRLFLAEYTALSRPESLRGLLSYCFWQADAQKNPHSFNASDHEYHLLLENLATDITNGLKQFKKNEQFREEFNQSRQALQTIKEFSDVMVFVDVAPEDMELAKQIEALLKNYGFFAHLPDTHSRTDIEGKLFNLDAVLILYEQSSVEWIKNQLLVCNRINRTREEPFKIVAVHVEQNKPKLDIFTKLPNLPNLQVFYCPFENVETYLPDFIEALKNSDNSFNLQQYKTNSLIQPVHDVTPIKNDTNTVIIQKVQHLHLTQQEKNMSNQKVIVTKSTVHGSVIAAEKLEKSFNTLQESNVDIDIKELLESLLNEIKLLNQKVPENQKQIIEDMASDTESLIKETKRTSPRQQQYQISADGIKSAARTLGEIATPVISVLEKILSLLILS